MAPLSDCVCIFDLDGTLVDSAPDLAGTLNRMLVSEGLAPMEPSSVRSLVGEGARALMVHGFAHQGRTFPEGAAGDSLVQAFIDDYALHLSDESVLFEGAAEALEELSANGATLAVCTNKPERLTGPVLRDFGIADRFAMVLSADSLAEKKPSPMPLLHIMAHTGAARGVMIGDTVTDMKAAEAAELPSLLATFGYGAGDDRLRGAATFDTFSELPNLVKSRLSLQPPQA